MKYETIRLSPERPISRIVMTRGESGNAVDSRLIREMTEACDLLRDDQEVRVVVLSAEGEDFCTGWATGTGGEMEGPGVVDPFGPLARLPMPVVAAVQGRASSAGLELALACDVRIAAEDALFDLPDTAAGLLPRAGGSQRLPRLVGRGRALAMLLTGESLGAVAAYHAGLVTKVVPRVGLTAAADGLAESIAGRGPIALRYAKEAVSRGLEMTLDQALRYETDLTVILQTTEDRAEGVRAFLEDRRTPRFKGK